MSLLSPQLELFQDNVLSPSNPVKTHKDFADCRYDISINEIKIVLGLISLIRKSDNEFRTFKFSVTGLARYLGIVHKNRCPDVRAVIERLESKKVILPDDGLPVRERPSVPWLSRCQVSESKNFVELKLNPELAELLTDPEIDTNYLAYQLAIIWQMKSTYSVKIYHLLLKHYWENKDGKVIKNTFERTITELKDLLKIPADTYPLPGNFKDKVINIAREECKKYADLIFDVEPKRNGRSIVGYKFIIARNPDYKPEKVELEAVSSRHTGVEKYDKIINDALKGEYQEAVRKLIYYKVTKSGIAELINICKPEQILFVIKNIEKSTVKPDNIAGAIRQGCREMSQNQLSEYDRILLELEQEQAKKHLQQELLLVETEAAATLTANKQVSEKESLEEYLSKLGVEEFNTLVLEFLSKASELLKARFVLTDAAVPGTISRSKLIQYLMDKNRIA